MAREWFNIVVFQGVKTQDMAKTEIKQIFVYISKRWSSIKNLMCLLMLAEKLANKKDSTISCVSFQELLAMCWLGKCFTSSKKKIIHWRKFSQDENFKNFVSLKSKFIFYEVLFSWIMGWKQYSRRKIGFTLNTKHKTFLVWIFTIAIVKINIYSYSSLENSEMYEE